MKLFMARAPLEDVAMDLVGEFVTTPRGNKWLLVIVDRFTKLVRTVPMKNTEAYDVAKAFVTHWVFTYGPPVSVLTDNGPQFIARFMLETYRILGVKELFTTTYRPQTNGQTERMNLTICGALRKFVQDHPRTWDLLTDTITYSYNTLCHESTGLSPFELVLSRPPPPWHVQMPRERANRSTRETKKKWLDRLRENLDQASEAMRKQQARYKANYDKKLQTQRVIQVGEYVLVRKEQPTRKGEEWHKLTIKSEGP